MKLFKNLYIILGLASLMVLPGQAQTPKTDTYVFPELWGYLMKGEEGYIKEGMPFTDIGYFAAQIAEDGRPPRSVTRPDFGTKLPHLKRVHLVFAPPWNKTIMNFCLRPDFPLRAQLIKDIIALSKDFDGVQIDFESLRYDDKEIYMSFLKEVRSKLAPEKMFSVAVPARWWTKENPFDYAEIAALADRVIVMAYDEHWRTGPAGPIASLPWCTKVLNFAKTYIPKEKLVMGLPLYGRAWQVDAVPEALKYFQTTSLCEKNQCVIKMTESGTPYFEFNGTFTIAVHFEDMQTLTEKVKTYYTNDIAALSFWRIGQEPAELWNTVRCLKTKQK